MALNKENARSASQLALGSAKAWERGNRDLLRQEREETNPKNLRHNERSMLPKLWRNDVRLRKTVDRDYGMSQTILRKEYDTASEAERNAQKGLDLRNRIQQHASEFIRLRKATGRKSTGTSESSKLLAMPANTV